MLCLLHKKTATKIIKTWTKYPYLFLHQFQTKNGENVVKQFSPYLSLRMNIINNQQKFFMVGSPSKRCSDIEEFLKGIK